MQVSNWTCGATFISKHYAITASHCVDDIAINGSVTLQKIMTTNVSLQEVLDASVVSGTSNPGSNPPSTIGAPSYSISDQLTASKDMSPAEYFSEALPCSRAPNARSESWSLSVVVAEASVLRAWEGEWRKAQRIW